MDITSIIQHVFKQPSLEGVSLSELEKFTAKQPFFAVGQYLLLRKMQDIRDPGFEKQLQKTRLYFENPLWLQQLLLKKNEEFTTGPVLEESDTEVTEELPKEKEWVHNDEIVLVQQPVIAPDVAFTTVPVNIEPGTENTEELPTEKEWVHNDEIVLVQQPVTESIVHFDNEEIAAEAPVVRDIYREDVIENNELAETIDQPITDETISISAEEEIIEEFPGQQLNVVDLAEQESEKNETSIMGEPVAHLQPVDLPGDSIYSSHVENLPTAGETEANATESVENSQDAEQVEEGKPGFVMPVYTKPAGQKEDDLVFQAYHTIDYFASQGIKISHKIEMSDKLGSQLKSFTEWLKTMKRLPPSKLEQQMEEKESEVVVEMAAHSLESKEVLTETMAEVLLKQGKKESAIEVYNKLSLLNPSKTPYFAAKIEAIKQN